MALSSYDIRFILSVSDRTGNSLRRVAGDMRGVAGDAQRMRKAFTALDVGRGLQLRGLLGGAALGVAAQQAANFSTSVTKAATQVAGNNSVNTIGQNTIKLQKEILDLMGQFPATAQEQADAAYDIFSAMNVPLQKGVGLLKLFNMVAVAGATDLQTATNAMITILNNFGGSWQQTLKAVNTSFAIIRFGRLEFSEFNDMLNAVVPSAKAAGQSLEDVSGAMALVTKLIPSQKQGATAIARLLEVLTRTDFRKGAKKLGLDIETAAGELRPLPQIIAEISKLPIAKATSTINQLFQVVTSVGRGGGRGIQSTVQARRALILLVKEYKQYVAVQKGVTGATSEFEKRYTLMISSAGVKWERFKAQLQALLILVGAAAIPLFEKLGDKVSNAVDWARQNRGMIEFAAKATFAVAVTSLLAGTFLKLYGSALIVYTGLRRLIALNLIVKLWGGLTLAIDAVTAALGRYIFATGAATTASTVSAAATGRSAKMFAFLNAITLGLIPLMRTLATRIFMVVAALFALDLKGAAAAGGLARAGGIVKNFTRYIWLLITALTTLNFTALRGLASVGALAGLLGKIAKIGAIGLAINVGVNIFDKKKRDRAWFLAKHGALGSAGLQAIFGRSFGTEKWFASDEWKKQIEAFDAQQKAARKDPMQQVKKGITSDFKKWLADIQKDIKSDSGQLFTKKMFEDMGLDANALNEQIDKLINQPAGGTNKQRLANEIAQNYKDLMRTVTDKLIDTYQQFKSENEQAFGTLFQGPLLGEEGDEARLRKAWNWTKGAGGNLLADMTAQLNQFRKWRRDLEALVKKGFSKEFVAEIKSLGPEAQENITKLLKAGPKRVKQFNAVFAAGKKEVEKATEIDFKRQLAKWNSFGKDTAFNILAGFESENQVLQTRMSALVEDVYGAVARTIAEQQAKLNFAITPTIDWSGLTGVTAPGNKPSTTIPRKQVRAAGLDGRFAVPSSAIGSLPVEAVQALGDRGNAMAAAWRRQTLGGITPVINNYTFQVDGTFLTEQEMMDQALKQAAHRTKNKR